MAGNCMRTANNDITTTEWEDIQYKFGNKVGKYATQEEEIQQQKMKDIIEEAIVSYDPLESRTVEQLDEMLEEDGRADNDEDVLVAYRRQRKAEMLARQQGSVFGSIRHITKPEYVDVITKAGEGIWVLVLLVEEGDDHSSMLLRIMGEVAERHPHLKFVSIKSTDAIATFPKANLPTVLLYNTGDMKKQITGLQAWAEDGTKKNPTVESVEDHLRILGPLRNVKRTEEDGDGEDEDEEEDDTRGPSATGRVMRESGKSKFSLY
ncbi:Viral IAP-associated factor-like protein [Diplonema papillatum]|nr:Viral IAP-associated factor-like protein [Diplonema papillatum]